jgi:hypothetical protein
VIVGEARVEDLLAARPRVAGFGAGPVSLPGAEVLQAVFEMPVSAREAVVPPALHPTNPALCVILAWRCPESPWGPFSLAQVRAQTRSGLRPRGFVVGAVCDNPRAADALATDFGFPARPGEVLLRRAYDAAWLEVGSGGQSILTLEGLDPEPLLPEDVVYSVTLNLAETPRGPRLLQVEPEYSVARAERLRPRLLSFHPEGWGDRRLDPCFAVSASLASANLTIPRMRFVCRPDALAFTGTEPVA